MSGAGQASADPAALWQVRERAERQARSGIASRLAQPKSWRSLMSRHASAHIKQLSAGNEIAGDCTRSYVAGGDPGREAARRSRTPRPSAALGFVHAVDEPSRIVAMKSPVLCSKRRSVGSARGRQVRRLQSPPVRRAPAAIMHGQGGPGQAGDRQLQRRADGCCTWAMHHVKEIDVPLRGTCSSHEGVHGRLRMQTETSERVLLAGPRARARADGRHQQAARCPATLASISRKPPPVPWWDDLRYFWRGLAHDQLRRR